MLAQKMKEYILFSIFSVPISQAKTGAFICHDPLPVVISIAVAAYPALEEAEDKAEVNSIKLILN